MTSCYDLIAQFVRMAFGHRFASEQESVFLLAISSLRFFLLHFSGGSMFSHNYLESCLPKTSVVIIISVANEQRSSRLITTLYSSSDQRGQKYQLWILTFDLAQVGPRMDREVPARKTRSTLSNLRIPATKLGTAPCKGAHPWLLSQWGTWMALWTHRQLPPHRFSLRFFLKHTSPAPQTISMQSCPQSTRKLFKYKQPANMELEKPVT